MMIFHAECCPLGRGMVKDERCWAREHAKRERKGGTGEITDISQAPAVACAYQDTFSRPVPENIHSEDILSNKSVIKNLTENFGGIHLSSNPYKYISHWHYLTPNQTPQIAYGEGAKKK